MRWGGSLAGTCKGVFSVYGKFMSRSQHLRLLSCSIFSTPVGRSLCVLGIGLALTSCSTDQEEPPSKLSGLPTCVEAVGMSRYVSRPCTPGKKEPFDVKDLKFPKQEERTRLWTGERPRLEPNLNTATLNAPPKSGEDPASAAYEGSLRRYGDAGGPQSQSIEQDIRDLKEMGATSFNPDERINLNFQGEDLNFFLRQLLSGALGVNYIAPDNLGGSVSFKTEQPIAKSEVIKLVRDILARNGYVLRRMNGVYHVGTAASFASMIQNTNDGQTGDTVVRSIPLTSGSPYALAQALGPLLPPGITVVPAQQGRALIVRASEEDIPEIQRLVTLFIDNGFGSDKVAIIPITNSPPDQMAAQITAIYAGQSQEDGGRFSVIPLTDQQALLVSTSDQSLLNGIKELVSRLDRRTRDEPSLRILPLDNLVAEDVASQLNGVFGGGGGGSSSSAAQTSAQVGGGGQARSSGANASRGGLDGTGFTPSFRPSFQTPSLNEDDGSGTPLAAPPTLVLKPVSPSGGGKQDMLSSTDLSNRASSEQSSTTRQNAPAQPSVQGPTAGGGSGEKTLSIVADKRNNALLIYSSYGDFRRIREVVKTLDVPLAQVVIEATIVEVDINDALNYGVQWYLEAQGFTFGASYNENGGAPARDVPGGIAGISSALGTGALGGYSADIVLNALQAITNVKVISSPYVTVMDGKTARLVIGDQIPFSTRTAETSGDTTTTTQEITTRDTGIILQVTPQIKADNSVILAINQEVSTPRAVTTATTLTPTISTRNITSDVTLQSGRTVLLGGLIQDRLNKGESGVPILRKIPVLGGLFRQRTHDTQRVELLVMITPKVIRKSSQLEALTKSLRRHFHQ